jgi:hypothetical protein
VPVHAHHHEHGVSVFVGHHHEHHHPKTVIVSRNLKDKSTEVDIHTNPTADAPRVRVVDVPSKANIVPIGAGVRTKPGETRRRSQKRVSPPIIRPTLADPCQRTLNVRHYDDEPEVFVEDAEPDVVIEEDDYDHYEHDYEHIDIDRRGLLDGLLKAVLGVIDIVSPGLSKTLDGVLNPVLGSLLLAAEPNGANQFAMQASTTGKSNMYLVEDSTASPLFDGSRVVLLQTPVFDEASQSMRTFCATFSAAANAPSPLIAAECSKANEASQRFGYQSSTGELTPLHWIDPSSTAPSSRRAEGMPCYDTVESPSMPSNVTAQTISLRFTPNTKAQVPHIKGASMPIALGASEVAPTATTNDAASTETPTSTVEAPAEAPATPTDIVQDIEGLASEEPDATTTTTDGVSLPEETPVEVPAAAAPFALTSSALKASNPVGRLFVLGFRPSSSPVAFKPSSS